MDSQDSGIENSQKNQNEDSELMLSAEDDALYDEIILGWDHSSGPIPARDLADDFDIDEEFALFKVRDQDSDPGTEKSQNSTKIHQQETGGSIEHCLESAKVHEVGKSSPVQESKKDLLGEVDLSEQDEGGMLQGSEMNKQSNANHDNPSDVSSSEDEHDDLHNSISSPGSFDSDSEKETDSKPTTAAKAPIKSPADTNSNASPKDITNYMNQILRETRYFLMKSNNEDNVELSKSKSVWSTPPANESKINQAVKETRNVILIFSVKESGQFSGFARVVDTSKKDGEQVHWVLPPGLSNRTLGSTFDLDWVSKKDLSFTKTQHLFNPWNEGKPVKIGRDGQEIEPHVAAELCRLFPSDSSTDWSKVTSRLKNSVSTRVGRISAPIGGMQPSSPSYTSNVRGRGFPNRPPRGGFISPMQGHSRSFDYGRGRKRQFDDHYAPYDSRPKRASFDSYSTGYGEMSDRYYRDPRAPFSSSHKSTSRFLDYHPPPRDFHQPPPVAPLPYPPPPPFDSLPPPPRYYDGPPIPEFPPVHSRMRDRRSSSPYEKSVTDFLRRAGDRPHPHRDHDRDRKYYRH